MKKVVRVGVVDDHEMLCVGFAAAAYLDAKTALIPVVVVSTSGTVEDLLKNGEKIFDVVALDMSLADGSRPGDNVRRIIEAGYKVLVFSQAANAADLREALAAGASGISRKTDTYERTLSHIRKVADGETIDDQQLAAAIQGDSALVEAADLTTQELQTLRWYAAGHTRAQVAKKMGIEDNTVKTYISRIRKKYAAAGRDAKNQIDIRRRAIEDGHVDPD
jgi:DNA-binding NarL/FixJ family response regulator